jgi:hypothetical protein
MTAAAEAIARISRESAVELKLDGRVVTVDGQAVPLPDSGERDVWGGHLLNLRTAFPSRAHGDDREKQLFKIVQDASEGPLPARLDSDLYGELSDSLLSLAEVDRQPVANAMRDEYWTVPGNRPTLTPYHDTLATGYQHTSQARASGRINPARYKLFRGIILLFLCWDDQAGRVRAELIEDLLGLLRGQEGFTLLDRLMTEAAAAHAGEDLPRATVDGLLGRQQDARDPASATFEQMIEETLGTSGAFCQPALDRFQVDLETVLKLRRSVPRRDLIDELTALLSLHLGIYYYRVALVLGERLDDAIRAADGMAPAGGCDCSGGLSSCALAGRILFRVGTRGDRPVRLADGCVRAYVDLDGKRLLPLSATIVTANLAHRLWGALGGPGGEPDLTGLAAALRADSQLNTRFNAGAAAVAAILALETEVAGTSVEAADIALRGPGLFALQQAVLAARRKKLKYLSRDVVNQFLLRPSGGSLISRRSNRVTFFELDEDFLFLLVKLICRERQVPFDQFVTELRHYGLAPQDDPERQNLADGLERLGILKRYSDAGESAYVEYPL